VVNGRANFLFILQINDLISDIKRVESGVKPLEGLEEEEVDPLYLKKFVKDHPDNKMGWYLLGKQYESQGKEGKAKYCFAQAGDVYSAFEMTNPIKLEPSEIES
jgi:hypothetical protein